LGVAVIINFNEFVIVERCFENSIYSWIPVKYNYCVFIWDC